MVNTNAGKNDVIMALMIIMVLIKRHQLTKKPATLRYELPTFEGKWVK